MKNKFGIFIEPEFDDPRWMITNKNVLHLTGALPIDHIVRNDGYATMLVSRDKYNEWIQSRKNPEDTKNKLKSEIIAYQKANEKMREIIENKRMYKQFDTLYYSFEEHERLIEEKKKNDKKLKLLLKKKEEDEQKQKLINSKKTKSEQQKLEREKRVRENLIKKAIRNFFKK